MKSLVFVISICSAIKYQKDIFTLESNFLIISFCEMSRKEILLSCNRLYCHMNKQQHAVKSSHQQMQEQIWLRMRYTLWKQNKKHILIFFLLFSSDHYYFSLIQNNTRINYYMKNNLILQFLELVVFFSPYSKFFFHVIYLPTIYFFDLSSHSVKEDLPVKGGEWISQDPWLNSLL